MVPTGGTAASAGSVGTEAHLPSYTSDSNPDEQDHNSADDDRPFIVLTETKFSFRCIPVWIGTLLTGLGSKIKHM